MIRKPWFVSALAASCGLLMMIACGSSSKENVGSTQTTPPSSSTNAGGNGTPSADLSKIDICSLVTKAEAGLIMGEIKGGAETSTGLHNEKRCSYSNMNGNNVSFGVYSADFWEMKRMAAKGLDTEELSGLGQEAFSVRRGGEHQIYVRKEAVVLEVNSSGGREMTKRIAEKALSRL